MCTHNILKEIRRQCVSDNTVATTSRSLDDMAAVVSRIDRNDNAQRIVFACLFSATKFNLCCSSVAYREV